MRAFVMPQPGTLRLTDIPDPACGPDEVLLETESVSICSTDISYYRNHLVPSSWPVVPGHEYVGRVVQVGSEVDGVELDERLVYWGQSDFGGLAELRAIRPLFPAQQNEAAWYTDRGFFDAHHAAAIKVPADVPSHLGTMIEPLTSVLRCLLGNPPKPGDVCVVLGCGPSALLAIQVLRRVLGAGRVVAVDKNPARLAAAVRMGADMTFDTVRQVDELEAFVRAHQDHFADFVVDALPHVAIREDSVDIRRWAMGLLRPGGTYVVYGATQELQAISTWHVLAKGLRLQATPFDVRLFSMARSAHVLRVAGRMIADGTIDAEQLVTDRISFDDPEAVARAFAEYGRGESLKTAIVATSAKAVDLPSTELMLA